MIIIIRLLAAKANNECGVCLDKAPCEEDELIAQKYYKELNQEL